jgi:hypothetical protein
LNREYKLLSEKYAVIENKYNASQRTNLDSVISEYIKDNIMPDHRQFDFKCEAHKIIGMDETDGLISIYLYICFEGYCGTKQEAGASIPMLVVMKKEDNKYIWVENQENPIPEETKRELWDLEEKIIKKVLPKEYEARKDYIKENSEIQKILQSLDPSSLFIREAFTPPFME